MFEGCEIAFKFVTAAESTVWKPCPSRKADGRVPGGELQSGISPNGHRSESRNCKLFFADYRERICAQTRRHDKSSCPEMHLRPSLLNRPGFGVWEQAGWRTRQRKSEQSGIGVNSQGCTGHRGDLKFQDRRQGPGEA